MMTIYEAKSNSGTRVWLSSDDTFTLGMWNLMPTERNMMREDSEHTETTPEILSECFPFVELCRLACKVKVCERRKIVDALSLMCD